MGQAGSARRITISDVASHAGVSRAAVSKVLRKAYGVSPTMQRRVTAAIDELGYRPLAAARALRGRTYTIGVVLDTLRNPFFADILDGFNEGLADTDYQVLIGSGDFGASGQTQLTNAMVDRQVDGLLMIAPGIVKSHVVGVAADVPMVVIGHHDRSDQFDSVVNDDALGAEYVVDHLVNLGHRRIGHTTSAGYPASRWRLPPERVVRQGYERAMRRHGLRDVARVSVTAFSEEGGYAAAMDLLTAAERPSAIFAGADIAAFGVFRAAAELGLRIPEDLSIAGYNNTVVAQLAPVDLTSVDQAGPDMGLAAARLLLERIDGRTRSVLTSVSPRLVVRGTTAPPS